MFYMYVATSVCLCRYSAFLSFVYLTCCSRSDTWIVFPLPIYKNCFPFLSSSYFHTASISVLFASCLSLSHCLIAPPPHAVCMASTVCTPVYLSISSLTLSVCLPSISLSVSFCPIVYVCLFSTSLPLSPTYCLVFLPSVYLLSASICLCLSHSRPYLAAFCYFSPSVSSLPLSVCVLSPPVCLVPQLTVSCLYCPSVSYLPLSVHLLSRPIGRWPVYACLSSPPLIVSWLSYFSPPVCLSSISPVMHVPCLSVSCLPLSICVQYLLLCLSLPLIVSHLSCLPAVPQSHDTLQELCPQ